jgi:MFS-type transporter involved in bile tolerance (Atg22 family)
MDMGELWSRVEILARICLFPVCLALISRSGNSGISFYNALMEKFIKRTVMVFISLLHYETIRSRTFCLLVYCQKR